MYVYMCTCNCDSVYMYAKSTYMLSCIAAKYLYYIINLGESMSRYSIFLTNAKVTPATFKFVMEYKDLHIL